MDGLNSELSRKRKLVDEDAADEDLNKRSHAPPSTSSPNLLDTSKESSECRNHHYDNILSSAEEMLSTPLELVFRRLPSSKPLLSRSEAQCLLQVNMAAHCIDSLTKVAEETLQEKIQCNRFIPPNITDHPYLRPVHAIATLQETHRTESTLFHVHSELSVAVSDLSRCARTLRQSSEQNWSLSETLMDTEGAHTLAAEKRMLSDIQDELLHRMDSLLLWQQQQATTSHPTTTTSQGMAPPPLLSMAEYCTQIVAKMHQNQELSLSQISEVAPSVAPQQQQQQQQQVEAEADITALSSPEDPPDKDVSPSPEDLDDLAEDPGQPPPTTMATPRNLLSGSTPVFQARNLSSAALPFQTQYSEASPYQSSNQHHTAATDASTKAKERTTTTVMDESMHHAAHLAAAGLAYTNSGGHGVHIQRAASPFVTRLPLPTAISSGRKTVGYEEKENAPSQSSPILHDNDGTMTTTAANTAIAVAAPTTTTASTASTQDGFQSLNAAEVLTTMATAVATSRTSAAWRVDSSPSQSQSSVS